MDTRKNQIGLRWLFACVLSCCLWIESSGQGFIREIRLTDLSEKLQGWLETQGVNRSNFMEKIATLNRQTAERQRDGEYDHLIYFLLQSNSFTSLARIEPALSAYGFTQRLGTIERTKYLAGGVLPGDIRNRIPGPARARISAFLKTIEKNPTEERIAYFARLLASEKSPAVEVISKEYVRAMRFLYRKEFELRGLAPRDQAAAIAALYQSRGHSTDTQIEANFAVHTALASLKAGAPALKLNRVLIVGPGLDFAPRTDLLDGFEPQSYQPFATADALLGLGLSDANRLSIHCVDISPRVIGYLEGLGRRERIDLSIISGVAATDEHRFSQEFIDYFCKLGDSISGGADLKPPAQQRSHLRKSLQVRTEIARRIGADRLNIVTERYDSGAKYDLIVVTNVFPYFSPFELSLAAANLKAMLGGGGYLIHNELQPVPLQIVGSFGPPLTQARTILIASGSGAPIFDGVAVHQKSWEH